MSKNNASSLSLSNVLPIPTNFIERRIHSIRGQQVMLDSDLAELYQVPTFRLNEAVKRNTGRFPKDFMFQLNEDEALSLRSQFAISNLRFQFETSKKGRGGRRYLPYAFTEYGVVMLSSVLNSHRAIQMNITIVKAFIQLREMLEEYSDLSKRVAKIKGVQDLHTKVLNKVVKKLDKISSPPHTNVVGFRTK